MKYFALLYITIEKHKRISIFDENSKIYYYEYVKETSYNKKGIPSFDE